MTANKGEAGWAAMFDDADRDKNGFMTVQELRDMMKRNNSSITESEIVEIFINISAGENLKALGAAMCDPDNTVTKQKFIDGMKRIAKDSEKADQIFATFDKDGSGFLDKFEVMGLIKAAKNCDDTLARTIATSMFETKDVNNDGKLSKNEIIAALS